MVLRFRPMLGSNIRTPQNFELVIETSQSYCDELFVFQLMNCLTRFRPNSLYQVLFPPKKYYYKFCSKSPRRKAVDDDCLIVGMNRDSLKTREAPRRCPDILCPMKHEYYKKAVERVRVVALNTLCTLGNI